MSPASSALPRLAVIDLRFAAAIIYDAATPLSIIPISRNSAGCLFPADVTHERIAISIPLKLASQGSEAEIAGER